MSVNDLKSPGRWKEKAVEYRKNNYQINNNLNKYKKLFFFFG